jgi:hypothetical protein
MKLRDIINPLQHLIFQPFHNSRIWDKDLEQFVQLDLLMIYSLVQNEAGTKIAKQATDIILRNIYEAYERKKIRRPTIKNIKVISTVISLEELSSFLKQFSEPKQKALIFCLLTGLTPTHVSGLTWKNMHRNIGNYSVEAINIIRSMTRYISCPFLFYENGMQISNLEHEIRSVTKMKWCDLNDQFQSLIEMEPIKVKTLLTL